MVSAWVELALATPVVLWGGWPFFVRGFVDKTGTLTLGKPKLVEVSASQGFEEREILRLGASLEQGSEHPLGAAIVNGARERGVELGEAEAFQSITGRGIIGRWRAHSRRDSLPVHRDPLKSRLRSRGDELQFRFGRRQRAADEKSEALKPKSNDRRKSFSSLFSFCQPERPVH